MGSIKIGIVGCLGKMGQSLIHEIKKNSNLSYVGGTSKRTSDQDAQIETLENLCEKADVIIDFSSPTGLEKVISNVIKFNTPLVSGTTGLDQSQFSLLEKASEKIPVFYSANYSLGIFLMHQLIEKAVEIFPEADFDILEVHHTEKKDSPSGTALALKNTAKKCGVKEIPTHAMRAGKIFGEHSFILTTDEERISIKHEAHTRATFAKGALRAAVFLTDQKRGYYKMKDLFS